MELLQAATNYLLSVFGWVFTFDLAVLLVCALLLFCLWRKRIHDDKKQKKQKRD